MHRTGRSARIDDYRGVRGHAAAMMRHNGYGTAVAAPVVAGGRTWGLVLVASNAPDTLGPDAERRLGDFAELLALGLESAEAREQLNASRLRILEAGLNERRRLERNLHDGAQQRLVSLAIQLRVLETQLDGGADGAKQLVSGARRELDLAMKELRELARGLHPAILTQRGLAAALGSLADSAALPVGIIGASDERLPEAVEAGAYFVVAESITNAVKHANASGIEIRLERVPGGLRIQIADDGRGGADPSAGTGLRGLSDRIEALGGRFSVADRPGGGTVVSVELPGLSRWPRPARPHRPAPPAPIPQDLERHPLERLVPRRPAPEPRAVERQRLARERGRRRVRQPALPRGGAAPHPRDGDVRPEPAAVRLVADRLDERRHDALLQGEQRRPSRRRPRPSARAGAAARAKGRRRARGPAPERRPRAPRRAPGRCRRARGGRGTRA